MRIARAHSDGMKSGWGRVAAAATLILLGSAAHATNYSEGSVGLNQAGNPYETNDLSSNNSSPTNIGALTLGSNVITGATIPYGSPADPNTGALPNQDNDYVTFTVPTGDMLAHLYLVAPATTTIPPVLTSTPKALPNGTIIQPGDQMFIGVASGTSVNVTPPSSAGLLGYTLLSTGMIGSDVLPEIGASAPPGFAGPPFSGATTFTGPLGAGTYSLWLLDGDRTAYYKLDLDVSAAPETASWAMFIGGFGLVGSALRRRAVGVSTI